MNKGILLTIVTIVYNGEKTILDTLLSVQKVADPRIEHLIIDGASSDKTLEIVNSFSFTNYSLRVFSEPDKGISDAFNKGVSKANGKFIAFLNADDFYLKDNFAAILGFLEKTSADIVCAGMCKLREGYDFYEYLDLPKPELLYTHMSVFHPSCFIRKAVFDSVGLHQLTKKVAMDYDLLLRAKKHGAIFEKVNFYSTVFRIGGVSSAKPENIIKGYKESLLSQIEMRVLSLKSLDIYIDRYLVLTHPKLRIFYAKFRNRCKSILRII